MQGSGDNRAMAVEPEAVVPEAIEPEAVVPGAMGNSAVGLMSSVLQDDGVGEVCAYLLNFE